MESRRIGDLLVDAGVVSRAQLEETLARSPKSEKRLLSELYERSLADERQLAAALAQRVGAPVAVLTESTIDLAALRAMPEKIVRDHLAMPVAMDQRTLTIATPNPEAPGLVEPLSFTTGKRVVPILGIHAVLEQVIASAYAALRENRRLWRGDKSSHEVPHLAVAAWRPQIAVEEANELAKQIIEALTPKAGAPSKTTAIGAIRLKQMVIDRKKLVEKEVRLDAPAPVDFGAAAPPSPPGDDFSFEGPLTNPGTPPLVLVVDDDEGIRTMLKRALTHDGCHILEAANGDEAVALLREHRPKLLVLDAMLPGVHGFEICASLKRSEHHRGLPVIMISAVYRGWIQAREIQEVHGADAFLEKPFELQYLRRMAAELLQQPRVRRPPARAMEEQVEVVRKRFEEHVAAGLWRAAAMDVDSWLALDPFDGRAFLERGNLSSQAGDLVGAMGAFEAAVVYNPELLLGHLALAMVYEQLGFTGRAKKTWMRAYELADTEELRGRIAKHLE